MTVRVLGGSRLLSELVAATMEAAGFDVAVLEPDSDALVDVDTGDVLVVRIEEATYETMRVLLRALSDMCDAHTIIHCPAELNARVRSDFFDRVSAIIPESAPLESLTTAVPLVAQGFRLALDDGSAVGSSDTSSSQRKLAPISIEKFSHREVAILTSLRDGKSNKDIAKELGISDATVKVHLRSVYQKMNARNRTQAALWASRHLQA